MYEFKLLNKMTVLIVEDNLPLLEIFEQNMKRIFHKVFTATTSEEAEVIYKKYRPAIIFTDINLPGKNGIEFVENIRKDDSETKIIVVTSHTDKEYLLSAVTLKLEDYILKPFDFKRVRELLEKYERSILEKPSAEPEFVEFEGGIKIDALGGKVYKNDQEIRLTKTEKLILDFLIKNKNRIISYETIEDYIWAGDPMSKGSLKTLIYKLRKKFGSTNIIVNHKGVGYEIAL